MLLVDDEQARLSQRCPDGGSGADDDGRSAVPGHEPGLGAFTVADRRMEYRHVDPEALPETGDGLGAQTDLWDQHKNLTPRLQHPFDDAQIDLGLAAAGHPFEQKRAKPAQGGADRLNGLGLARIQHRGRRRDVRRWQDGFGRYLAATAQ